MTETPTQRRRRMLESSPDTAASDALFTWLRPDPERTPTMTTTLRRDHRADRRAAWRMKAWQDILALAGMTLIAAFATFAALVALSERAG